MTDVFAPADRRDEALAPRERSSAARGSRAALWTGRVVSAVPVAMLLFSAGMGFAKPPAVVDGFTRFGWPESLALPLGIVQVAATILYLIPQTAVLGAILLTGFFGGATATHVRIGDPWFIPVVVGVLVWLGLYLREPRLRSLVPLRRLH